jgi:nucleotide-binding universal stress UspA family protein
MRVLCATDFSPLAAQAATVAGLWSRRSDGDVRLIHAGTDASLPGESAREWNVLAKEAHRLQQLGATVVGADVVVGLPDVVLLDEAARQQADLVVLGAVGHRLGERWMFGSVAARTARESPVPLLVIRDSSPFQAWLHGSRTLRVVAGYERGESANNALRWTAGLTRLGVMDLTVIHLVLPGPENRRTEAAGPGMGIELRPETERRLLEELRNAVRPLIGEVSAHLMVKAALGRRDIHLVLQAEELHADLLVVGSHQRKGFQRWWQGSVSSGVLHAASMSVAVVPYRPAEP